MRRALLVVAMALLACRKPAKRIEAREVRDPRAEAQTSPPPRATRQTFNQRVEYLKGVLTAEWRNLAPQLLCLAVR